MSKIKKIKNFDDYISENFDNVESFIPDDINNSDLSNIGKMVEENEENGDTNLFVLWKKEKGSETDELLDKIRSAMEDSQAFDYSRQRNWLIEFTGDAQEAKRLMSMLDYNDDDLDVVEEEEESVKDKTKTKEVVNDVPISGENKVVKNDDGEEETFDVSDEKVDEDEEDVNLYDINKNDDLQNCNFFIVNGCDENEKIDTIIDNIKQNLKSDCTEIHLYQLNIKDSNSEKEPKDGMDFIYKELDNCDGLIFVCDSNIDNMKILMKRLKNHYIKGELKNKVFGIVSDNEDVVDIVMFGINLGMIICGDCICDTSDNTNTNAINSATSMLNLCNSTKNLRCCDNTDNNGIMDYDSYEKSDKDSYKYYDDVNMNNDNEEEMLDSTTEEEERLIDNLDGTITHIHNGKKDTNQRKGEAYIKPVEEEEEISITDYTLPFSNFDRDLWKKYEESNMNIPFQEYIKKNENNNKIEEDTMDFETYLNQKKKDLI